MVWDSGVKKGLEFRVHVRLAKSEGVLLISMLVSEMLAEAGLRSRFRVEGIVFRGFGVKERRDRNKYPSICPR